MLACVLSLGIAACMQPKPPQTSDATSSDSAQMPSDAPAGAWQLVWQDDFSGEKIDESKWSFEQNCWGGGNNEKQCYTNRATNAYVADGVLHIVAKKETFRGAKLAEHLPGYDPNDTQTLPYTSAKINTKRKADWLYGRFEIRAKLPTGQGTWPAIWMLPSQDTYGGWAASGEIDIMEAVNLGTPDHVSSDHASSESGAPKPGAIERSVHGTLHHALSWPDNLHSGAEYDLPGGASPADDFHTYAIEWQEGEIRWYVDGKHYATQTSKTWYSAYKDANGHMVKRRPHAPFDHHFYLLINLAVGGGWSEAVNLRGVDPNAFPAELLIDFVKVYECVGEPASCANIDSAAKVVTETKKNDW